MTDAQDVVGTNGNCAYCGHPPPSEPAGAPDYLTDVLARELTSVNKLTAQIAAAPWKIAENQISAALKKHGLLLMVDPDGNYGIEQEQKE